MRFPNFEGSIRNGQVLERGESYFRNGQIRQVNDLGEGRYFATVASDSIYNEYGVHVKVTDTNVIDYGCQCPYAANAVCKHIVAVLMSIRFEKFGTTDIQINEDDIKQQPSSTRNKDPEIFQLLKKDKKDRKAAAEAKKKEKKSSKSERNTDENNSAQGNQEPSQPPTVVEKEFECQVCLDRFINPVLMPCHVHSACLQCVHGIFKRKKEENHGKTAGLEIFCPTCGDKSGRTKFAELKLNKELIKVMDAYEYEKNENNIAKNLMVQEDKLKSMIEKLPDDKIQKIALDALKILTSDGMNVLDITKLLGIINLNLDILHSKDQNLIGKGPMIERNQNMVNLKNKTHPHTEEEILRELNGSNKDNQAENGASFSKKKKVKLSFL